MTTKKELRNYYLRKRQNLSDTQFRSYNEQLSENFYAFIDLSDVQYLHTYLPIAKNKEPDTWRIIHNAQTNHPSVKIVIPRTTMGGSIEHYLYDEQCTLKQNEWGIPEPTHGIQVSAREIDLVIVPLLAFDESGHRLGYGKGYYDRFLAECRNTCKKIGLSFFEPVAAIPEVNDHDIPLDCFITPSGIVTP